MRYFWCWPSGGHARGAEAASSQAVVSAGSHTVLTVAHFVRIQKFILDKGKRRTYCNMFNNNPCWKFPDFNAYLNPPDQRNINCEIGKSAFDILVIQVTKPGPARYWDIALNRTTNGLRIQQHYARTEPKALIQEASEFFEKALTEIDRLAPHKESSAQDSGGRGASRQVPVTPNYRPVDGAQPTYSIAAHHFSGMSWSLALTRSASICSCSWRCCSISCCCNRCSASAITRLGATHALARFRALRPVRRPAACDCRVQPPAEPLEL